jgi:hypothetical protein
MHINRGVYAYQLGGVCVSFRGCMIIVDLYICILNEITSVSHRPCNVISSPNPHDLLEYLCHRDLYSGKAPDIHPAKPAL